MLQIFLKKKPSAGYLEEATENKVHYSIVMIISLKNLTWHLSTLAFKNHVTPVIGSVALQ